jgi:hypothetical protein
MGWTKTKSSPYSQTGLGLRPSLEGAVTEIISKRDMREQLFAREYLLDLNGTRAAIAAGYSSKTAAQAASRMPGPILVDSPEQ